jgi:hypothetical protein
MEEKKIKYKTNFLFPRCTFIDGLGSVLNLDGNYYEFNGSKSEADADRKALISDWENVGDDIRKAIDKFENQNNHKLCLK